MLGDRRRGGGESTKRNVVTMSDVYHIVKQGEHLSGIALKYNFHDYLAIWNHPENKTLKEKRKTPHILLPGDTVFIPARETKDLSGSTERRHKFQVKMRPLRLKLKLENAYDRPIADTDCELRVEFENFKLRSDGEGQIEQRISKTARLATLIIKDKLTVKEEEIPFDVEVPIKIAHLDPVEEPSGQRARLANLGYYRGSVEEPDEREFTSAIEEFQCEHGLTVDGKCGAQTQAKLKEAHGC